MVCDCFSLSFSVNGSTKHSEDYAKYVGNCSPRTVLGVSQAFVKEAHFLSQLHSRHIGSLFRINRYPLSG